MTEEIRRVIRNPKCPFCPQETKPYLRLIRFPDTEEWLCPQCGCRVTAGAELKKRFDYLRDPKTGRRILRETAVAYNLQGKIEEVMRDNATVDFSTGLLSKRQFNTDLPFYAEEAVDKSVMAVLIFKVKSWRSMISQVGKQRMLYRVLPRVCEIFREVFQKESDMVYYVDHGVFVCLIRNVPDDVMLTNIGEKFNLVSQGDRSHVLFEEEDLRGKMLTLQFERKEFKFPHRIKDVGQFVSTVLQVLDTTLEQSRGETSDR